jgi:hypothetical protein
MNALLLERGLAIQKTDLEIWRKIIKPELFSILLLECERRNAALKHENHDETVAGFYVFRGSQMQEYIVNRFGLGYRGSNNDWL